MKKAAPRKAKASPAEKAAGLLADFLARADAYAAKAGIKRSTLSLYLLKDGKGLDRIAAGGDIGLRQLERAELELAKRTSGQVTASGGLKKTPR